MNERRRRGTEPSAPRLYVHGVSVEEWTRRWGVEPFTTTYDCGRALTTTRPFVQGTLRGLEAPPCECGCMLKPDARGVIIWPPFAIVRDSRFGDLFTGGDGRIDR